MLINGWLMVSLVSSRNHRYYLLRTKSRWYNSPSQPLLLPPPGPAVTRLVSNCENLLSPLSLLFLSLSPVLQKFTDSAFICVNPALSGVRESDHSQTLLSVIVKILQFLKLTSPPPDTDHSLSSYFQFIKLWASDQKNCRERRMKRLHLDLQR